MDDLITYLLNFAMSHGIGFETMPDAPSDWASIAVPEYRKIMLNFNWENKREIPFQIAHEISHLLNKDNNVLYHASYCESAKHEAGANLSAIDILIGYYQANYGYDYITPELFMKQFGIPNKYEYQVEDRVAVAFGV